MVGESGGVTRYHLRQLAAFGFVVEDDAPQASRKERWWKAAHRVTVLETLGSVYLLATLSPFVFRVWREMDHPRISDEAAPVTV